MIFGVFYLLLLVRSAVGSFYDGSGCTDFTLRWNLPCSVKSSQITVITTTDLSPFVSRVGNGVPFGLDIDLMNYIGYIYRINFQYRFVTLSENIPLVQADPNAISITAQRITPERLQLVDFAQFFQGGSGFSVRSNYSQLINGLEDLCGKKVSALSGSLQLLDVQQQNEQCGNKPITILATTTLTEALDLVNNRSADVAVSDQTILISAVGNYQNQLKVLDISYNVTTVGILCNKKNNKLCCALVNAINYLIQEGIYQELLQKYSLSPSNNGICPSKINLKGFTCEPVCRPSKSFCKQFIN